MKRIACSMTSTRIGMGQPAENEHLNQIGSAEFFLPLNTACLASQHIGPLF